jgi:hypothetical protein
MLPWAPGRGDPAPGPFAGDGQARARRAGFRRLLWTACAAVLAIDVLLGGVLVATQGRLPGVWEPAGALRAGEEARVVGEGLLVRSGPSWAASPLGQLESGAMVRLTGAPVTEADGGRTWWPIAVGSAEGESSGWVLDGWLQADPPPTLWDRFGGGG